MSRPFLSALVMPWAREEDNTWPRLQLGKQMRDKQVKGKPGSLPGNGFMAVSEGSNCDPRSCILICHFERQPKTFMAYELGSPSLSISGKEICLSDFCSWAWLWALAVSALSSGQGREHVVISNFFGNFVFIVQLLGSTRKLFNDEGATLEQEHYCFFSKHRPN